MKRIIRILVLAVALVSGLTTVSAQTIQALLIPKVSSLPSTVTSYLDDPFRYFNVQFIVSGAGSNGIDVFFDMNFTVNTNPFYVRTRPGSIPMEPIHLSEGINIMRTQALSTQIGMGRVETNIDYSNPLGIQQLPEGTYEICLDFYEWTTHNPIQVVGPCPSFVICYSGSAPELVSPMAGAQMALNGAMVVTPSRKINFFWTPVISNCASNNTRFKYQLKVVKVLNGQNYHDAIKFNPTVLSTEVRNNNYAVFDTLRDIKVQMERGALYVAQVQAEQIKTSNSAENFIIANDGVSQPMPFFWGYVANNTDPFNFPGAPGGTTVNSKTRTSRTYGFVVDEEDGEGEISEGIAGLTLWEGGVEEVSELDEIIAEALPDGHTIVLDPKRHYVESDGYYTIPMADDIEIGFLPMNYKSFKDVSYTIELYDYVDGGVDSITAYEPLFSETIEKVPGTDTRGLINRTLDGWGAELEQGGIYYLQQSSYFTVGYWNYLIADTFFYVNEMLAEHVHDTISREFSENRLVYSDGVYFQWGDDPEVPTFTTPQWKAPVDRSGDDIYDPVNHKLPTTVPEVKRAKSFPISWTPVKGVAKGDEVEYEVNVYELKKGQTMEAAVAMNDPIATRTLNTNVISEKDEEFFKVFSTGKTYLMTLSTVVASESNFYHFENGNESLPIIFKIVK